MSQNKTSAANCGRSLPSKVSNMMRHLIRLALFIKEFKEISLPVLHTPKKQILC